MVSAEFECGPVGVSMMQTSAAPGDSVLSPASAEASYLRGMAASVAASGASPYSHPESILPHSHHPHMQVRHVDSFHVQSWKTRAASLIQIPLGYVSDPATLV